MPDHHARRKVGTDQAVAELSSSPGAASLDACILRHVSRTSRAVVAAYDPALVPFGLTGHQFNLMTTLGNMGSMTVGALADTLGMDASGVPRAIRPLTDEGLVAVERGEDRRQRVLSLTPTGRKRLELATPAWSRVQTELIDMIGATRWQALMLDLHIVHRAAVACSSRKPAQPVKKK